MERMKNFNFDEWRRRYMRWLNHNKSRAMDFFRKMDKDHDGKLTREEFIEGVVASSKLFKALFYPLCLIYPTFWTVFTQIH